MWSKLIDKKIMTYEIKKFGTHLLGHHYNIIVLSDLCLRLAKRFVKEIMHFHYMTYMYMATPQHKNPCPGGHEIYNFGRPFLGHHYYSLGLYDLRLGVEKKMVKEIMHFHYLTYMTTPLLKNPCPRGHEIYNFSWPFLGHHYYILGLSDLCLGVEKKIV